MHAIKIFSTISGVEDLLERTDLIHDFFASALPLYTFLRLPLLQDLY